MLYYYRKPKDRVARGAIPVGQCAIDMRPSPYGDYIKVRCGLGFGVRVMTWSRSMINWRLGQRLRLRLEVRVRVRATRAGAGAEAGVRRVRVRIRVRVKVRVSFVFRARAREGLEG